MKNLEFPCRQHIFVQRGCSPEKWYQMDCVQEISQETQCRYLDVAIQMLLFRCCYLDVAIQMLLFRCCYLDVATQMSLSRCCYLVLQGGADLQYTALYLSFETGFFLSVTSSLFMVFSDRSKFRLFYMFPKYYFILF